MSLGGVECEVCAQCKGPSTRRQGRLQKVLSGAPIDVVAVDVLSGLPITPDGKKYILVLTDYFTKWACAFALPDAEASTCMRTMYDGFFADFGLPRQLHSDLGKNFESKLFYELCLLAGVNKSHDSIPPAERRPDRTNEWYVAANVKDNCGRQSGHMAPAVTHSHGGIPYDGT